MGSISSMMKGSGLEEVLGIVYGHNILTHTISGKAVSRALHGHFLVQAALFNKLMSAIIPCQEVQMEYSEGEQNDCEAYKEDLIVHGEDKLDSDDAQKIHDLYEEIQHNSTLPSAIAES